jgi:antitoxin StbD
VILYKFWYTLEVANPVVIRVHPLAEVRSQLSGILARFRREGAAAEPVAFGSHRKAEAILLPYEVYERYEALARQIERLETALSAAQSVQVELPGPFSPEQEREVAEYVDGKLSADELYLRTVARYRQP